MVNLAYFFLFIGVLGALDVDSDKNVRKTLNGIEADRWEFKCIKLKANSNQFTTRRAELP